MEVRSDVGEMTESMPFLPWFLGTTGKKPLSVPWHLCSQQLLMDSVPDYTGWNLSSAAHIWWSLKCQVLPGEAFTSTVLLASPLMGIAVMGGILVGSDPVVFDDLDMQASAQWRWSRIPGHWH